MRLMIVVLGILVVAPQNAESQVEVDRIGSAVATVASNGSVTISRGMVGSTWATDYRITEQSLVLDPSLMPLPASAGRVAGMAILGAVLGAAAGAFGYMAWKCWLNRDEFGNTVDECNAGSEEGFKYWVAGGAVFGAIVGGAAVSSYSPVATGALQWRGASSPSLTMPRLSLGPSPGSLRVPLVSVVLPNW